MKIKLFLVVLISFGLFHVATAQNSNKKIKISGTVTDKTNNPVRDVFLMIDGKTTDVKTNDQGKYIIKVRPSVTKIGVFTTLTGAKEEPINGRTVIDFKLDKMIVQAPASGKPGIGEEVVDEGYGSTTKKSNSTKSGSRTDVSGSQYASFSSIYEVLRTVPGVMVSGSSVSIRGIGTTGSAAPLYVVDGVTMSNIGSINPSVVKSVEVLKGPAASVYGIQGANGVIMIRLK
jgi:TonB-dependent SusC/RagA subfamily outer membrane receptor